MTLNFWHERLGGWSCHLLKCRKLKGKYVGEGDYIGMKNSSLTLLGFRLLVGCQVGSCVYRSAEQKLSWMEIREFLAWKELTEWEENKIFGNSKFFIIFVLPSVYFFPLSLKISWFFVQYVVISWNLDIWDTVIRLQILLESVFGYGFLWHQGKERCYLLLQGSSPMDPFTQGQVFLDTGQKCVFQLPTVSSLISFCLGSTSLLLSILPPLTPQRQREWSHFSRKMAELLTLC